MLTKLFGSYRFSTFTGILILSATWVIPFIAHHTPVCTTPSPANMPLYNSIVSLFATFPRQQILTWLLLLFTAIYLNQLNSIHHFISAQTYFPASLFIILTTGFSHPYTLTPETLILPLLTWATAKIINSFKSDSLSYSFFDASFLIGIASLIYFPAILFIALLFIVLFFFRTFQWREWLYTLMGISILYGLVAAFHYLCDWPVKPWANAISMSFSTPRHFSFPSLWQSLFATMVVVLLLAGSFRMMQFIQSFKIFVKKIFMLWFIFFLVSVLLLFFSGLQPGILLPACIPLSYLFSQHLSTMRTKWLRELFLLILIALLVTIHVV